MPLGNKIENYNSEVILYKKINILNFLLCFTEIFEITAGKIRK